MSFCSARNFAAILRRAKFGKVQIARACGLLNLAASFIWNSIAMKFLRLSSKFRTCRISTLKFHGRRCKQDKILILKFYGAEFSAEAKREAV